VCVAVCVAVCVVCFAVGFCVLQRVLQHEHLESCDTSGKWCRSDGVCVAVCVLQRVCCSVC